MADTIRERIITAFAARAQSLSNLSVERAKRSIDESEIDESEQRFVSIWDGEDEAQDASFGVQSMQFPLAIEVIWREEHSNFSIAANAIIGEAIALMLNADRTYGDLAHGTQLVTVTPTYPADGSDIVTITFIFIITYSTLIGDPFNTAI